MQVQDVEGTAHFSVYDSWTCVCGHLHCSGLLDLHLGGGNENVLFLRNFHDLGVGVWPMVQHPGSQQGLNPKDLLGPICCSHWVSQTKRGL